ncbi:hypothetical protein COCMIDRAFT_40575 [Bipolaris oryzae ATCC 44560]|uniref:Uncharacterized protein n=1 Tax=Bipolaris oryzae ATCC 44560 TaxID=930090 RepID=W6YUJ6_COCMI|nr:uncharacterized protein COCMIDRAFT_40575 [Bipolaris oryzae ATCC 44560]EUC41210.1 hypothetical protein COCMIDRAFT_40575 [Bipolaris oryzae ATCC 44560]
MGQRAPCAANEAPLEWLGGRRPIDLAQSRRSQEDASMQGKRYGGRVRGSQACKTLPKRPRWQCATPGSAQRPVWG